jgi:IS5 family transposase
VPRSELTRIATSGSSLLWDSYRTLARLIEQSRELDPKAVGQRRIHLRRVKKASTKIARMSQAKGRKSSDLKVQYEHLICQVTGICDWAAELVPRLRQGLRSTRYRSFDAAIALDLAEQIIHFEGLARHVIWQATERVLNETPVPNDEKIFSIFEEHSELLKRGKAGKPIEFGHMIQIQQTDEKFITGFEVFAKKPVEPTLVLPAIESHEALFGHPPRVVTADKGYWSEKELEAVFDKVDVVSIPKKGRRNSAEEEREHDPLFKIAQRFRAGVEGSISFLKRVLRLARCMNKGWEHFVSTVSATVLAHNLLVLARC